jgi:hypothetical protein
VFRVAGRKASISSNHRPIDLSPSFRLSNGLEPGANGRRSAFVDALGNEVVDLSEEFLGQPYSNLFGGHGVSIPTWDA